MPTEVLPVRTKVRARLTREPLGRGVWLALGLHALLLAITLIWAAVHFKAKPKFGSANPVAGSIQASMVSALPLPPRAPVVDRAVLASEKPNIAPPPPPRPEPPTPRPKAEPKPAPEPPTRKDSVLLDRPAANRVPAKSTPKAEPRPPSKPVPAVEPRLEPRPTPPAPPTPKATTGETSGVQIPQSTTELKNGTATITVEERSFGERFAYYIRLISQKVNEARSAEEPDPAEARGKRTVIRFTIDRDGTPTEATVQTRSGSLALDRSALRAIQHIDTFGPLPAGDHLTVDFGFTDH